ncbi:hypothetical protein [Nocardia brasiliensis]|uniref:hypothetical protein n=1 Tax=Nocardia brasiliensis TaxID=37326 RepID=UPI002457068B|nr:hypothetical protein [Nocardia brasiliensis]
MTELPTTTKSGRIYLRRFVSEDTFVYRTPDKPGNGVSRTHLDRLLLDGLVTLGDKTADGQLIRVTELGIQVLHAHPAD